MRARSVVLAAAIVGGSLCLTSCLVGVGDWERFSKDVHFSYPLKAGGRLEVETFNGSVDISGWDQNTVDITGTKYGPTQAEADDLKVQIDNTPDSVSIRVPRPSMRRNNQGAQFAIKVPRNTVLSRITTSNGSIRTMDGSGPARLRTSNSSIHVADLQGSVVAETSNGSVELGGVEGDATAHTTNSRIHADRVNGSLDAVTSNGAVQGIILRPDRSVHVETSNSSVELSLPQRFTGDVRVSTNNGGITLRMPESTNARISARTSNSSITTDFEVKTQGEISRNRIDGVIGAGGPLIDLSTSNSGIRLLRR
jgi:hypothetical protein